MSACMPDLTDQHDVIQHIRDLLNLAPLLDRGLEEELSRFNKRLLEIGWGVERISQLITYGGYGNRFEYMKDSKGDPLIPRPIRSLGSQREWGKLKSRTKK